MRILFISTRYLPAGISGSEVFLHSLIKFMQSRGHTCRVLLQKEPKRPEPNLRYYDDVEIFPVQFGIESHFLWAERVVCQLEYSKWAIEFAKTYKRPITHITHSMHRYEIIDLTDFDVRVLYNSNHSKDELNYNKPSSVLYPPVRQFKGGGKYITLSNLNENKGSDIFYRIAALMPKHQFLAVKGTYGSQVTCNLPNVITWEPQIDMSKVYKQTSIMLMPSRDETFGIVGAEAMAAGIPVICSDLPALRENLGDGATYLDRLDIHAWIKEIKDIKKSYLSKQEICNIWRENRLEVEKTQLEAAHNLITR